VTIKRGMHEDEMALVPNSFVFNRFVGFRLREYIDQEKNVVWIGQDNTVSQIYSVELDKNVPSLEVRVRTGSSRLSDSGGPDHRDESPLFFDQLVEHFKHLEVSLPESSDWPEELEQGVSHLIEQVNTVVSGFRYGHVTWEEIENLQADIKAVKDICPQAKTSPLLIAAMQLNPIED
jgi:hypothetical protein